MTSLDPGEWRRLIAASHALALGEERCAPDDLDDFSGVVLCHDTAADPVFVYANQAAVRLWQRPCSVRRRDLLRRRRLGPNGLRR